MKYVCLVYLVEKEMDALSTGEAGACTEESPSYDEALRGSGHLMAAQASSRSRPPPPSGSGTANRPKEQLGGFFLIEAKDLDEACAVAARFPPARIATIEVRPVQELRHS